MTLRSRWFLGAFAGALVGFGQLLGGVYLMSIVLLLLGVWAYVGLGKAGLGGLLLLAGAVPLVRLLPEMLFGCGGGPSLHGTVSGVTTCVGPPSSFWQWWTAFNILLALVGLALTVLAARRSSTGAPERC